MSTTSPPNQNTIAERAGVTKATVSLALRNSPLLPEGTRQRIQNLAKELGYRPNPMVNSLMKYVRTSQPPSFHAAIVFVTNFEERDGWMRSHIFSQWFHGARERAGELGYVLDHFWLNEPGLKPERASKILWNRGIKGVLFAPMASAQGTVNLDLSHLTAVAIGYTLRSPKLPCVSSNHFQNSLTALRQVEKLGYRSIGLAIPRFLHERVDFGWLAAFNTARQIGCSSETHSLYGLKDWTLRGFQAWLKRTSPEVVIAGSPEVWEWIQKLGIKVPEQMGYVSLTCSKTQEFSGIDENVRDAGITAVQLVIEQIERNECGVPAQAQTVLIEGNWVPGKTLRAVEAPRSKLDWERPKASKARGAKRKTAPLPTH